MAGDAPGSSSSSGSSATPPLRLLLLTACLACVGGAIDTVSFIGLNGLFTAHVTGNFVLAGAVMAGALQGTVTPRLMTIPFFGAAVSLCRAFVRWYKTRCAREGTSATVARRVLVTCLIGAQLCWFLLFMGLSHAAAPVDGDTALSLVAGMCGVVAMGIQNACSKLIYSADLVQTTVMTGNTTQLCVDLVDVLAYRFCRSAYNGIDPLSTAGRHYALELEPPQIDPVWAAKAAAERKQYGMAWSRFCRGSTALCSFVVGALCSAVLFEPLGFWCVLVPASLLPVVWWLCVQHPDLCAAAPPTSLPAPTPEQQASSAGATAADHNAAAGAAAAAAAAAAAVAMVPVVAAASAPADARFSSDSTAAAAAAAAPAASVGGGALP